VRGHAAVRVVVGRVDVLVEVVDAVDRLEDVLLVPLGVEVGKGDCERDARGGRAREGALRAAHVVQVAPGAVEVGRDGARIAPRVGDRPVAGGVRDRLSDARDLHAQVRNRLGRLPLAVAGTLDQAGGAADVVGETDLVEPPEDLAVVRVDEGRPDAERLFRPDLHLPHQVVRDGRLRLRHGEDPELRLERLGLSVIPQQRPVRDVLRDGRRDRRIRGNGDRRMAVRTHSEEASGLGEDQVGTAAVDVHAMIGLLEVDRALAVPHGGLPDAQIAVADAEDPRVGVDDGPGGLDGVLVRRKGGAHLHPASVEVGHGAGLRVVGVDLPRAAERGARGLLHGRPGDLRSRGRVVVEVEVPERDLEACPRVGDEGEGGSGCGHKRDHRHQNREQP